MGPKQNHSAFYSDLNELLENKFSRLNQRIDAMEQTLNDTHKDFKKISTWEVDKTAQEAISDSQKNEGVIDKLKFRVGEQEEMLK